MQLAAILNSVQRTTAAFPKALKLVDTLLGGQSDGSDEEDAAPTIQTLSLQLIDAVDRILVITKKDPAVIRLIDFASRAAALRDGALAGPLLRHLVANRLDCKDKVVRLHVCEIIDTVLRVMPDSYDLDDKLYDDLRAGLLARTRDSKAPVRAKAAAALCRLSDPDAQLECPITAQLAWLVAHDASPDVRAAALKSISLNSDTLALLLDHTRDVSADVRCAAFNKLADLVDPALLTKSMRVTLLRLGLSDSSAEVVKQATLMLLRLLAVSGAEAGEGPGGVVADERAPQAGEDAGLAAAAQAPTFGYSIPAFLEGLAWEAPEDERAAEAALFALFAFAEGPAPRAPPAGSASAKFALMSITTPSGPRDVDASPPALWAGARAAIAAYRPDASDVRLDDTLYWRVRAAWLAGHAALGAGPQGVASTVPASVREEALEAWLPSVDQWNLLLRSVLFACGVDVGDVGNLASSGGGGEEGVCAFSHVAPTAAYLTRLRNWRVPAAEALQMARQLLLLGQLLDFSDEASRRAAVAALARALPHPALTPDLVTLLIHTLSVAAGCGAPVEAAGRAAVASPSLDAGEDVVAGLRSTAGAYRSLVDLLGRTLGALTSAAHTCLSGGTAGTEGGAGATGSASGGSLLSALRTRAEGIRMDLEAAYDAMDEDDSEEAAARVAELKAALAAAEDALAAAECTAANDEDGGLDDVVVHAVSGSITITAGELGCVLSRRASALARALLAGASVPTSVHQSVLVPVVGAALRETLSAASSRYATAQMAVAGPSSTGGFDAALADALLDEHPLLAGVLLPSLSPSHRQRVLLDGSGEGDEAAATAIADALAVDSLTALGAYLTCQPREAPASRLARGHGGVLMRWACDSTSAPAVRAAAVSALSDVAAVLGAGTLVTPSSSLFDIMRALVQPEALLQAVMGAPTAGVPFAVQAAAARGLLKLIACGQVPAGLPVSGDVWCRVPMTPGPTGVADGCAAIAASWPLAGALTSLQCLYWAAVLAAAVGTPLDVAGEAASAASAVDADGNAAAGTAFALSSLLHTLSQGFQTVARMSVPHKAALLGASTAALRWMLPMARTIKITGPVAGLGPAGSGAEEAAGSGGAGSRKKPAARGKGAKATAAAAAKKKGKKAKKDSDDDEDEDEEGVSSDGDDMLFSDDKEDGGGNDGATTVMAAGGVRPPRAPAPVRPGSAAVGPSSSRSVVSVGSSMSALASGGGGGSAVGVAGRWVAMLLSATATLAAVEPVAALAPVGGNAQDEKTAAVSRSLACLCPALAPLCASAADGEEESAGVNGELPFATFVAASQLALAALWLSEAAADAAVFGPTSSGSLLAVFVPALASLPPPSSLLPEGSEAVDAVLAALTQDLLRAVVTGARSASGEKAVRKLAGAGKWELPIDAKAPHAGPAVTEARALLAARSEGLRAAGTAAGVLSAAPAGRARSTSSSSASGLSAAVGPAARAPSRRATAPSPSAGK